MKPIAHHVALIVLIALATAAVAHADSIVINGSFEDPAVTNGQKWDIYEFIPGWSLSRGPSIEIQRGVSGWLSAAGAQYVELDSDIDGPGGALNGEAASSAIYQDLATSVGTIYELRFAFSPRPGVLDNRLEIKWNGTTLDTLSASGLNRCNVDWEYHTYTVTATSPITRLEFGDRSVSDSYGTFLDDVSVAAVPEPASLVLLLGGLITVMRKRTR